MCKPCVPLEELQLPSLEEIIRKRRAIERLGELCLCRTHGGSMEEKSFGETAQGDAVRQVLIQIIEREIANFEDKLSDGLSDQKVEIVAARVIIALASKEFKDNLLRAVEKLAL
jgi:hypothetical protein